MCQSVDRLPGIDRVAQRLQRKPGVGPEDLQYRAAVANSVEDASHPLVLTMTLEVDQKDIVAQPALGGAAFDLGHLQVLDRELRQDGMERTRDVLPDAEGERGLVVAGRRSIFAGEDDEAGHVGMHILNIMSEDRATIQF